jgi:hypothetical protein
MLRDDHDGDDALLVEVGEHFVQMRGEVVLGWHRVEIAIQAIDNDYSSAVIDGLADGMRKGAWRHFGRVNLLGVEEAFFDEGTNAAGLAPGRAFQSARSSCQGLRQRCKQQL